MLGEVAQSIFGAVGAHRQASFLMLAPMFEQHDTSESSQVTLAVSQCAGTSLRAKLTSLPANTLRSVAFRQARACSDDQIRATATKVFRGNADRTRDTRATS
ncbi:hypothetical protein [Erythrobacter litoralis]|uniref:hypothetical protein n=1 Tax=Erythrobacter litoralis TaxID=39960 RepID=UPI0013788B1A|nr:hypothetical protein [Erythrobacter litoralis]